LIRSLTRFLDAPTRGWAVIVSGNIGRMALSFLASILIARHLGPADFGIYAVLGAMMNITGVIADMGLSASAVKHIAAVRATDPAQAQLWGQVLFWLRLGLAAVALLGGVLLAPLLARTVLDLPGQGLLVVLALMGAGAVALTGSINSILQGNNQFRPITIISLTNAGLTTILAVLLAFSGRLNLITALTILGIGTSLACFVLGLRLLPAGWTLAFPGWATLRRDGTVLARFGYWLGVANLLGMLTAYLDILLVNRLSPPAEVGIYALALNLVAKVDVVNQSLYTVLLPTVSALEQSHRYRAYIRRVLSRGALLALALLLLLPLARPFVSLFYGLEYAPAVRFFQLLLGVVIFDLFTTPLLLLAYPLNRPRLLAAADLLRGITLGLVALVLIPRYGPMGAIAAKFASRLVGTLVTLLLLRRAVPGLTQKSDPN
jgi:O-antigen/teichoic acid export membrane protein